MISLFLSFLPFFVGAAAVDEGAYDTSQFNQELLSMLFTLILFIAMLYGISWLLKRMQTTKLHQGNSGSRMKIIDHRPLSQKTSLYMVQVENKALVFAESVNGVTALTEFPLHLDTLVEEEPNPTAFKAVLYPK